jgi:AcrR family transcriptional regulator
MVIRSRRLERQRRARREQGIARRRGRLPGGASGDETRDRIIEAAVRLFAERGYGSTSVRDVARRAHVRVSTLYHHFRSKEAMYAEVFRRHEEAVRAIVVSCLDQNLDFPDMVRAIVERLFDYYATHRDEARLGAAAMLGRKGPWGASDHRPWIELSEGVLRPAAARGTAKEIDPALFMISVDGLLTWHAVNEAAYRRTLGNDLRDAETAERAKRHIVQIVLRGLGVE